MFSLFPRRNYLSTPSPIGACQFITISVGACFIRERDGDNNAKANYL
jgi:hypothetical protein